MASCMLQLLFSSLQVQIASGARVTAKAVRLNLQSSTSLRSIHLNSHHSTTPQHHHFYNTHTTPTTETSPSALRKAFRQQSLKWHPDKNPDPAAAETFHLLTVAYDVLSDPGTRAAYDAARNARLARKRRTEAFDVDRRRMKEDLESRERGAKKARTEVEEAEEAFERMLGKLQKEGAELRRRREEALRAAAKEAEVEAEEEAEAEAPVGPTRFTELDRTLKVRWKRRGGGGGGGGEGGGMTASRISALFSRFGEVQDVVVPPLTAPREGEKEKKFRTALVVFVSIVSAHAAVCEASSGGRGGELAVFRDVTWASGKEPDLTHEVGKGRSEVPEAKAGPRFASFGGGGGGGAGVGTGQGTDYESITLMRMRAAEKARIEAEIRRQDEEAEAAGAEALS
ncbi:DnaJ-domain-containing protein [Morchella conica CCBAS932]|uniref:DnaJ-domain-containing protein n=1 Tax=Morchella conica CCBAS932 TaxID=1392247 RepID=A0A3N4KL70_9PEZI|nr:DnaJ-domain-containing protein [Morchella conica CCBAS932]